MVMQEALNQNTLSDISVFIQGISFVCAIGKDNKNDPIKITIKKLNPILLTAET